MNFNADMIPEGLLKALAIVVSVYVLAVCAYLWARAPDRPWPYALAISLVGLAWLIRYVKGRHVAPDPKSRVSNRKLTQAIVVAGFLMAIPLTRQLGIG